MDEDQKQSCFYLSIFDVKLQVFLVVVVVVFNVKYWFSLNARKHPFKVHGV